MCRLLGRRPNDDVWIAGYDNFYPNDDGSRLMGIEPVATVDKRNYEIGAAAVSLLTEPRAGAEPDVRVIEPKLVIVRGEPARSASA